MKIEAGRVGLRFVDDWEDDVEGDPPALTMRAEGDDFFVFATSGHPGFTAADLLRIGRCLIQAGDAMGRGELHEDAMRRAARDST